MRVIQKDLQARLQADFLVFLRGLLHEFLHEHLKDQLFKLRFQFKAGQLTDYSRLSATRRAIARLKTVLRERELAAEMAGGGKVI